MGKIRSACMDGRVGIRIAERAHEELYINEKL